MRLGSSPKAKRAYLILSLLACAAATLPAAVVRRAEIASARGTETDGLREISSSPAFDDFDAWLGRHLKGEFSDRKEHEALGGNLALKRKEMLAELIRLDPKSAVKKAIPKEIIDRLPGPVARNLERHISSRGDFIASVFDETDSATGEMSGGRTEREVVIDGQRYEAFVYGRKAGMTSKLSAPLRGIALGNMLAVDETSVREIGPSPSGRVEAEAGGETISFKDRSEFDGYVSGLNEQESQVSPFQVTAQDVAPSPWTEGNKTVLMMRIDFPDRPGVPVDSLGNPLTEARVQNTFNLVNQFYVNNSYGKTSLQVTITPVIRMPQPSTSYNFLSISALSDEVRKVARAAGIEPYEYDLDITAFSFRSNLGYAGAASLGYRGLLLNGAFDFKTFAHELGHNYGLTHANLWRTSDGTVTGPGSNVEYGDAFDVMGGGGSLITHFNADYKRVLNWLKDENVQAVTADGVYRVFAFDTPNSPSGTHALKIRRDATKNYWVDFRQLITGAPNIMNGALLHWDFASSDSRQTQLLDMTPGTATLADSSILVGQSFYDAAGRIRISVLNKGNTTPESLDIRVELNVGCTFSVGGLPTGLFPASGGAGTIAVTTQVGCRPPASSSEDWIYLPPAGGTSESVPVNFVVLANTSRQPRAATLTVAGQPFQIQQEGATASCVRRPDGLVSWWRGEGGAADQKGVNNGLLVNVPSFAAGKAGAGFDLPGAPERKISVPDSPSLALTGSLTIEGWVKIRPGVTGGYIIGRVDGADTSGPYRMQVLSSGALWFALKSSRAASNVVTAISPTLLPFNEFAHVAGTLDGSTGQMRLYVNGEVVREITTSIRPYANLDSGLKPRVDIGGNGFNGVIDELSVYDRALSGAEIRTIYNAGGAGKCVNLNRAPTAGAGDDQTVEATSPAGAAVTLDGTASTDPDGDPLSFSWSEGENALGTGAILNTILSLGPHEITLTADDGAGGVATDTVVVNVVDTTAPEITITSPSAAVYLLNGLVAADYACSDRGSGVAGCSAAVANRGNVDTAATGGKSFVVTATDAAGNTSTRAVNYSVSFNVCPAYDTAKAHKGGSNVPFKLRLCDAVGNNASAPDVVVHAVGILRLSDETSFEVAGPGNSNPDHDFSYDVEFGGYLFNLKSSGLSAGRYALQFLAAGDPTLHTAPFGIR